MCDFLKPFKDATVEIQGEEYPTIGTVIPWYNLLYDHCYDTKSQKSTESNEYDAAQEAFQKLEKYYDIASKHLMVGVMLDPHYKAEFFDISHPSRTPEEVALGKRHAMEAFKEIYQQYAQEINDENESSPRPSSSNHLTYDEETMHPMKKIQRLSSSSRNQNGAGEITTYLKLFDHCEAGVSAFEWWKQKQNVFPVISRMARDYLGIPATSASSERAFSASGNLITDKRTSLSDDSIEANMCLRNWMVSGILERAKLGVIED